MLTTRFETPKMLEDETLVDFYAKLCDISNRDFALGEEYSNAEFIIKKNSKGITKKKSNKSKNKE